MRPQTKHAARLRRWERYVALAADAGGILINLRDQPRPLDWLGVGLRVLGLGIKIRAEHRTARAGNAWRFFDTDELDSPWLEVPEEFRRLIVDNTTDVGIDEGWWDGTEDGPAVCIGKVGGEDVGWIAERAQVVDGPYVRRTRATETFHALGERIWRRVGSRHCTYGTGGLVLDALDAGTILPTQQMRDLEERMNRFVDQGIHRSCLLIGPPGTGKSVAIRWLTRRLGVTSVRVDLAVLSAKHGSYDQKALAASLETLLKLLRPEALILDDLDRVSVGGELLAFLELAARMCRLVLASANRPRKMMGASLRPGRFDEIISFDRLDPDVLRQLLGVDHDLFDRLAPLPAAYVAEFLKRLQVLGRERAVEEIAELESRRALVERCHEDDKEDE
jgi:hypothetical protein